jgi:hypothetical protein
VLAGRVAEQWKAEAAQRSLDDPDPIPVRWRLTTRQGVIDHARAIVTGDAVLIAGSSDQIEA